MAGFAGSNLTSYAASEQCKISDQIEQFVACGLVFEMERREVTELTGVLPWLAKHIGEQIHLILRNGLLINHERIVQIATFDESAREQVSQFPHKAKRAGITHFCRIIA